MESVISRRASIFKKNKKVPSALSARVNSMISAPLQKEMMLVACAKSFYSWPARVTCADCVLKWSTWWFTLSFATLSKRQENMELRLGRVKKVPNNFWSFLDEFGLLHLSMFHSQINNYLKCVFGIRTCFRESESLSACCTIETRARLNISQLHPIPEGWYHETKKLSSEQHDNNTQLNDAQISLSDTPQGSGRHFCWH